MLHLRYNMYGSPNEHPQSVMRKLGITYKHSTPQTIADQWWFWNCSNVPETLPPYISELGLTPEQAIGHGLSGEDAAAIRKG